MSQKWTREMVSMKSREVSRKNRIAGSYADLPSIDTKANNDWIETGISILGEHVVSIISAVIRDKLLRDVVGNKTTGGFPHESADFNTPIDT